MKITGPQCNNLQIYTNHYANILQKSHSIPLQIGHNIGIENL